MCRYARSVPTKSILSLVISFKKLLANPVFWIFITFCVFSHLFFVKISKSYSSFQFLKNTYGMQPSLPYEMDLKTLFQDVNLPDENSTFHVLSAFKDPRTPQFITVIGVGHKSTTWNSFHCHFLIENRIVFSSAVVEIEPFPFETR